MLTKNQLLSIIDKINQADNMYMEFDIGDEAFPKTLTAMDFNTALNIVMSWDGQILKARLIKDIK